MGEGLRPSPFRLGWRPLANGRARTQVASTEDELSDILWVFTRLNLPSVIDILLVALIFYVVLRLMQGTQAVQLLRGIIIVVLLTILITSVLGVNGLQLAYQELTLSSFGGHSRDFPA